MKHMVDNGLFSDSQYLFMVYVTQLIAMMGEWSGNPESTWMH